MSFTDTIDVDIVPPPSSIHTTSPTNKGVQPCRACGQLCMKRNGPLVKALGEIYHYQCFVCEVQLHSCLYFLVMGRVIWNSVHGYWCLACDPRVLYDEGVTR